MATERKDRRELPRSRYEPHAKDPRPDADESELELSEDDEEFQTLLGDEPLENEPLPEEEQEKDIERAASEFYEDELGPPRRERLEAYSHELGRRYLDSATETDPSDRLERENDERYSPADRELEIRHDPRLSGTRDTEEGPGAER